MKKILMFMMCMTLLAGCGQDNTSTNDGNTTPNNNTTNTNDTTNQSNTWYDRFESGLKEKKVDYSTKSSLDATSIGGTEGYRYVTENGNIDVYRFEDGEAFNKIVKDKKMNMNGKDSKVEVNDHMIIVTDGVSDDVLNIFRGLK